MRRMIQTGCAWAIVLVAAFAFSQTSTTSTPVPDVPRATPENAPQVVNVDPPSVSMTVAQLETAADKLRERNLFRDAIDYYDVALKKEPKNAVIWNKRGIAQLQMGRYKDAETSLKKAIKADKKYPDAYNNLGVVYYKQAADKAAKSGSKNFERAIKQYRKALSLKEDSASFHSNLGSAYFGQGEVERAAAEYQRALQLDPQVFERQSRAGVAAHLSSPEDRAHFFYVLAKMYAQAGNFERSLFYLRRAVEDGYKDVNDAFKDKEFAALRNDPRFTELMGANRPVSVQ